MLKRFLIFILVATILLLTSCEIVQVIDHGTTLPPEETTQPIEYTPWGFWYSYATSGAIELTQGSNKAKLYSLSTGYYEYYKIDEVDCSYDGDATFILSLNDESLTFTFDKFANTLQMSTTTYLRKEKAPIEHPQYSYPDYAQIVPNTDLTIDKIDYAALSSTILEGAPYDIALEFYKEMKNFPTLKEVSRPAQSGDCVNIDFCGKLDGVAFEGGTATDVTLFISDYKNGYIPGFTDGIIGKTIGETFDVDLTFPEDYHATDLAGKAVVFTMTLNSICDLSLTDEQVAEYKDNDYQTYNEWLEAVKHNVANNMLYNVILEASHANNLPQESYLYFYQQTLDYYHMLAYYYNISYEQFMLYNGLSEMAVLKQARNQATYHIALYVLANENELTWTDDDYTAKYEEYLANYLESQKDATREEACEYADRYIARMKLELTEETVLEWAYDIIFPSITE